MSHRQPLKGQLQLAFGDNKSLIVQQRPEPQPLLPAGSASGPQALPADGNGNGAAQPWEQLAAASPPATSVKLQKSVDSTTVVQVKVQLRVVGGQAVAANLGVRAQSILVAQGVKAKRTQYTEAQKVSAITKTESLSLKNAVKAIRAVPGYEKVSAKMLRDWREAKPAKRAGRKVDMVFEAAVLNELIYTAVANCADAHSVSIVANVAYSYDIVAQAARNVQKWPKFRSQVKVQALKFSKRWVAGWFERADLNKRRVTTTEKAKPSVASVQETMANIQGRVVEGGYLADEVVSADETGIFYGCPPKHQYVPDGERAVAPDSDEKARFTKMMMGTAKGNMLADFDIIKCSQTKNPVDLTSTRVLKTLHAKAGFTAADGWEFKVWERKLLLPARGKKKADAEPRLYKRPYLIHSESGNIITVQHKAWMDTTGCCMWVDLCIGPHFAKKRGKSFLIWDSCGPHKTQAVLDTLKEWSIEEAKLPVNMTGDLQIMDLVGNAPAKAGIRRDRIERIFNAFQAWKLERLKALYEGGALPDFKPLKPTIEEGLLTSLALGSRLWP